MKLNKLFLAAICAALASLASFPANALPAAQEKAIHEAVLDIPVPELPPRAAQIVVKADEKEREEVAIAVVRAAIKRKPAIAAAVVGAISKVAPETSAAVAAEAAILNSHQATEIAKAAASAAPSRAVQIASAVAKAVPQSANAVARAVINAVPLAATKVVNEVVTAVPAAKTEIAKDAALSTVLSRSTLNSAATPGGAGSIVSVPGTIRGTLPVQPPTAVTATRVTSGRDPIRDYASP
jgi:hypothetical protein